MKRDKKINLDCICGYKEEKEAIKNIINLLNNYDKYEKQGVNIPRGLIFQGPPGTGKTLFAKAIAGECDYEFYTAFSSEIDERPLDTLKDIFKKAENTIATTKKPCLIYIDELDKIAYTDRSGELVSDVAREAVRFLLQKLDETKLRNKLLVIASTNNYRRIPHALLRSGRFDKKVLIDLPDTESRKEILELYINNHPLFKNIDTKALALKTEGMSGADLKTLINNTLLEYITTKEHIDLDDFIKVINEMNFETIGKKWNNQENALEVLAHEIGHALVSYELNNNFGTISALKYGNTAGSTFVDDDYEDYDGEIPLDEESTTNEKKLSCYKDKINDIIISLGGKVGEEIYIGQPSIGLFGDFDNIADQFEDLFTNAVYGFKYCRSFFPTGVHNDWYKKLYRKTLTEVKKYYRKAKKCVKKNKILGLYLIDEIHKNDDVLSNSEIMKRVALFNSNPAIREKYKKITFQDLNKEYKKENNIE